MRVAFCKVPKAACTNFGKILIELHGYNESYTRDREFIHLFLKNITSQFSSIPDTLWRNIKFARMPKILFVRYPFSRLLSGYLDKIYNPKIDTLPENIQKYLLRLYNIILNLTICKNQSHTCFTNESISFSTLVDSLFMGLEDVHFLPYTEICMPCSIPYTHIIRQETFSEDIKCLLRDLGITKFNDDPRWAEKQYSREGSNYSLKEFYSQLSADQINKLSNYTYYDHVLFDYKFIH